MQTENIELGKSKKNEWEIENPRQRIIKPFKSFEKVAFGFFKIKFCTLRNTLNLTVAFISFPVLRISFEDIMAL